MEKSYYKSPIGNLQVCCENNKILSLSLVKDYKISDKEGDFIKNIKSQLDEYFSGKRASFDIPKNPKGTKFQKIVWEELLKIPYGKTCSYSEIATRTGRYNSQRAVGSACNKNPIIIIIPCHRVIHKNGKIEGYACGNEAKKVLLNLEQLSKNNL